MIRAFGLLVLGVVLHVASAAHAEATQGKTIMFVCLHGAANSQMAAAHFNRVAQERSLPYVAVSRGIDAGTSIPTRIRDGLSLDGLEPVNEVPKPLVAAEAASAIKVVAFDAVPDAQRGAAEISYWPDVPLGITDYVAARDAIVRHIDDLLPALAERPRPRTTLQGIVTGIDERNDSITLRLTNDTSSEFKVQDSLLFDAVRYGDQVNVTVETIAGARTIVGLTEQ